MCRTLQRLCFSISILFWLAPKPAALGADADLSGQDARAVFLKPGTPASISLDRVRGTGAINFSPSLNQPKRESAASASRFIKKSFQVIGLVVNGHAIAYPVRILNWHEVVNDTIDGVPVLVTYCPLCQSGLAFERRVGGEVTDFDVCGLLYHGNMLLYDHKTMSLWTQLRGEAVTGGELGKRLKLLPVVVTTWKEWRKAHPETEALSVDTGFDRDYRHNPMRIDEMRRRYRHHLHHHRQWDTFTRPGQPELAPDAMVFGVQDDKYAAAVPLKVLRKKGTMKVPLGKDMISLQYKEGPRAFDATGEEMPGIITYWKMWSAFYPATDLLVESR
jgi:hypothetical protein